MTRFPAFLRRFARSRSGSSTVEFVLTFPAIITLMLSGIELGLVTMQHSMLERAMDITVRDIRLGTGTAPQHDQIKDQICQLAAFINNCEDNLRLEMVSIDPRSWDGVEPGPDCIDRTQEVTPVRSFVNGQENELMLMRACVRINPLFPTSGLGKTLAEEGVGGQYALIAMSAFVQEPR